MRICARERPPPTPPPPARCRMSSDDAARERPREEAAAQTKGLLSSLVEPSSDVQATDPSQVMRLYGDAQELAVQSDSLALLPDGTLVLATSKPGGRSDPGSLHRISREGEVLGVLLTEASWAREVCVGDEHIFFISMPADVNRDEYSNYPSSRVVRIPVRSLMEAEPGPGVYTLRADPSDELGWLDVQALSISVQTCDPDDDEYENLVAAAIEEADEEGTKVFGEARPEQKPGVPIGIAAEGGLVVVLHRLVYGGARPWEYNDDEYDESVWGATGQQPLPKRGHFVTVFKESETRPHLTIDLGKHTRATAPEGIAVHDGCVYVNFRGDKIGVFSVVSDSESYFTIDAPTASDIECLSLAGDRLYARSRDHIHVCDLSGGLLQTVAFAGPDGRIGEVHAGLGRPMRYWMRGLCVDSDRVHFLSTAEHPGSKHSAGAVITKLNSLGVH